MSTVQIVEIHEQYDDDGGEPVSYIVEYTIPDYSGTFRTDSIPATEYDEATAKEQVRNEVPDFGTTAGVSVEFAEEKDPDGGLMNRRRALVFSTVLFGGFGFSLASFLGVIKPFENEAPVTQAPRTEGSTGTPSPTATVEDTDSGFSGTTESARTDGETTSTSTATPSTGALSYDWEEGEKEGWERTDPLYGYSGHTYEYNVVRENSIEGTYSAQTKALNDRFSVTSPKLHRGTDVEPVSTVTGSFRLQGDLDASPVNFNRLSLLNGDGDRICNLDFHHGSMEIRWNDFSEESQSLQSFSEGDTYDIEIGVGTDAFTVTIGDTEYSGLQPETEGIEQIERVSVHCRNEGGVGPSVYDGPIYFTWDAVRIA
jgi:hypothetical protein